MVGVVRKVFTIDGECVLVDLAEADTTRYWNCLPLGLTATVGAISIFRISPR